MPLLFNGAARGSPSGAFALVAVAVGDGMPGVMGGIPLAAVGGAGSVVRNLTSPTWFSKNSMPSILVSVFHSSLAIASPVRQASWPREVSV